MPANEETSSVKPVLIRCSFCGKDQHQVRKIIAGNGVFICDECVFLCVEIIFYPDKRAKEVESESGA